MYFSEVYYVEEDAKSSDSCILALLYDKGLGSLSRFMRYNVCIVL